MFFYYVHTKGEDERNAMDYVGFVKLVKHRLAQTL